MDETSGIPTERIETGLDLIGRRELMDSVATALSEGRRLFAFEGITGVGKSALLVTIASKLEPVRSRIATVNAADQASEELAVATIIVQLKGLAKRPAVAAALKSRTDDVPVFRRIVAAVVADAVSLIAEKAERTIDVTQELISGDKDAPSVVADLEALDQANRRAFLSRFLQALDASGISVLLAIDNVDGPDLTDFIRFLVNARAANVVILLAHNTERGDNVRWDYIVADVKARRGLQIVVEPLGKREIEEWFHRESGRWPSPAETAELISGTNGRPLDLELLIGTVGYGGKLPIQGDYSVYYAIKRQMLSGGARMVAELLAIIPLDGSVTADSLALAAENLGVNDIGPALDQLRKERLLKERGERIALSHSLAQDVWRQGLTTTRVETLKDAWYQALFAHISGVTLPEPADAALLPVVLPALIAAKSPEVIAELGAQLVQRGQFEIGLALLDRGWSLKHPNNRGGVEMLQYALVAAEARLNLGRYAEVDEPLRQAEIIATEPSAKLQVVLLQMKLALRRNAYKVLWNLAEQFTQLSSGDSLAQADGLSTLNMAYRDLLDYDGISETTEKLIFLRPSLDDGRRAVVDRSIARALAKNGRLEEALEYAQMGLAAALELGSVRDTGNAYFARGEVLRYRSDYSGAEADYRASEEIARGIGNRDSQLWALIGQAAAQIESGDLAGAKPPLGHLASLLAEPGYIHPLESAHVILLRTLVGLETGAAADAAKAYLALGVTWPATFLDEFKKTGAVRRPIPF